jgi:hypothetical protein
MSQVLGDKPLAPAGAHDLAGQNTLAAESQAARPIHGERNFLTSIPRMVYAVALFVAVLNLLPYWLTQLHTPAGWTFTGNISVSPDNMQYRVWMRQSLVSGVLVEDKFTTEPNRPHLLIPFYYAIGVTARLLNLPPEFVDAYAGSLFGFLFTILLFDTVRRFVAAGHQTWAIFLTTLFGGGLGVHLKLLSNVGLVQNSPLLRRILVESLWSIPVFEDYPGNYIFASLLYTHFVFVWLVTTTAVLSLYLTLQRFTKLRLVLTCALLAAASLMHFYEGITLFVIAAGVSLLLWRKQLMNREVLLTLITCCLTIAAVIGFYLWLQASSGIPLPTWRGINILVSVLVLAYPVAWILIVPGIGRYWQLAGLKETFLAGWALGCLLLTLAGPFYPYPDRGTMTLQIPLYAIAGIIYFSWKPRVTWLAAGIAVLLLGVTPVWMVKNTVEQSYFTPDRPETFLSSDHQAIISTLQAKATAGDVLIANMIKPPWENELLWLAPEFPGKLYCGHYFLTVDYERKRQEVIDFYSAAPERQANFLAEKGIRFVFVAPDENPLRFEQVPGLKPIKATSIGTLLEFTMLPASR